jgi:lysozyme family protein
VTRRFVLAAGLLAAVASFSSCSTFNRSNAAAEVKGAQLTPSELMQLVSSDTTTQTASVNDGDRQRSMITTWLQLGVLGGDTTGITTYAELRTRMQTAIATISAPYMDAAR